MTNDTTWPEPLRVGDIAPDFTLPAVHRPGVVSLADYRGRPVLVALFRGLYCPFCRRAIARFGMAAAKLEAVGVETLGVVATTPERARLYFRFRPAPVSLAADPEFLTHRLYGAPRLWRADIHEEFVATRVNPTGELAQPLPIPEAARTLSALEGFEPTPRDQEDAARPFLQMFGQFLIDRHGTLRWTSIECANGRLAALGRFPTDQELLAAAAELPR